MPVSKRLISPALWQVFAVSLQRDAFFPRQGVGTNLPGFLYLFRKEPEVAAAIEKILNDTKWPVAELYSMTVGEQKHRFVFGSNGGSGDTKALFYPLSIEGELGNKILLNAQLGAGQNLLSFLWHQEGGLASILIFSPFGAFIAPFGWMLGNVFLSGSSVPLAVTIMCDFVFLAGVGVFLFPAIYSWWKRRKLRQALKAIASDPLEQAIDLVRNGLQQIRRSEA